MLLPRDDRLDKKSYQSPYLLYIDPSEAEWIIAAIHDIDCGNYAAGRLLVHKVLFVGYWPTMHKDSLAYTLKYDKCQRLAAITHQPPHELTVVPSSWSFTQWGLDVVGPLSPVSTQRDSSSWPLINYFTKWVMVETYANVKDGDLRNFFWKNIVCRFGIPCSIVSDNGTHFGSRLVKELTTDLNIKRFFSILQNSQNNKQVESTNKTLINNLKKRLEKAKGQWVGKYPKVLRDYRTIKRRGIDETPFLLANGLDVIIPTEAILLTFYSTLVDSP